MKTKIENYSFNKTAKTVTFTDFPVINLNSVLLITNVTRNIILYNFADPTKGGSVVNNVLTLLWDTTEMEDLDNLQIFYELNIIEINPHTGKPEVMIAATGHVCSHNSTTVLLGVNGVFNGDWQDALNYSEVTVTIYTNRNSVTDGLKVWWSMDGITADPDPDVYTITAGVSKTFTFPRNRRYVKVTYQNDGIAQNIMMLSTILNPYASKASSHRLLDNLDKEDDAQVTKSMIAGFSTAQGGNIVNVKVNPSGALTAEVSGTVGISGTVTTSRADNMYNDAFQRLRISNTDQRFDAEFIYDLQPLIFDNISEGAGSVAHRPNSRDVLLAANNVLVGNSGGLRQNWHNPYTPGNSQFIAITGVINQANLAGTVNVFLRSSVTGAVVVQQIPINAAVAWQNSQILLMDFQSLKVGKIRFALDRGGLAEVIAVLTNDNIRAMGYWQSANLPIYWRVYNTAQNTITEMGYGDEANGIGIQFVSALNATQKMVAICATVKSEGGGTLEQMAGIPFTAGNAALQKTVSSTLIPLFSIRVKTLFNGVINRGLVLPSVLEFLNDNPIYWEIRVNPALTGAAFASVSANSITEIDIAATTVVGGHVIASGYAGAGGSKAGASTKSLTDKIPLSLNALGTVGDILTVCAIRVGTVNATSGGIINLKEIR